MDINENIISNSNEEYSEFIIKKNKFDHAKKIDLVKRINKIKKKEYLLNIFKIIYNTTKEYTDNNNGIFIFFHNLSDEIYEKIDNYVNLIYKLHFKTGLKNIINSELSDNFISISESIVNQSDIIEIKNINKELSNKEKMIMRRKKYEEYLNQNQE